MLKDIVLFEVRSQLRRPAPSLFFVALVTVSFLLIVNDVAGSGLTSGKIYRNAPHILHSLIGFSSLLGIAAIAALVGNAAHRDIEHGSLELFLTLPPAPAVLLGGRFLGALIVVFVVFSGVGVGCFAATMMPWLDPDTVAPFSWPVYARAYAIFLLPNLFFLSSILFGLVASTRKMLAGYVGAALLFALYVVGAIVSVDLESVELAALLDPFGDLATDLATRYWTVSELNSLDVPLTGGILLNRALWGGLGALVLGATLGFFRGRGVAWRPTSDTRRVGRTTVEASVAAHAERVPRPERTFSAKNHLKQALALGTLAVKNTMKDRLSVTAFLAALIVLFLSAWRQGQLRGVSVYPVTSQMLEIKEGLYAILAHGILIVFSGELIWQERRARFSSIADSLPVPTWVLFGSRWIAMSLISLALTAAVLLVGLTTQTLHGFFDYELGLYLRELLLLTLPGYLVASALFYFIHVSLDRPLVSTFVALLVWTALVNLGRVSLGHPLYRYGALPQYEYTALNGYGPFVPALFWFTVYWSVGAVLLLLLGSLLWRRGEALSFVARARRARIRTGRPVRVALAVAGVFFVGLAGSLFYATEILHDPSTPSAVLSDSQRVAYERTYKQHQDLPQPRVVGVKLEVDLHPEAGSVVLRGRYQIRNDTSEPIPALHTQISHYRIRSIRLDERPLTAVLADTDLGYYIYSVEPSLTPGQSALFEFDLSYERRGLAPFREYTGVVANGTFFDNTDLPSFGYDASRELADNGIRRRNDLPHRPRFPPLNASESVRRNIVSRDADWITFEAVLSTSGDQRAVSPGRLERTWVDGNGRRYFQYRALSPIHNFYPILSARYAVREATWRGVEIEVLYHQKHDYNVERMVEAIKGSLDYYTANFGPYPHDYLRLAEYPRYQTNAQAFAGTIAMSEAIGFIVDLGSGEIDMPSYVVAHEMAHQWWGHQVVGANAQGAAMLSETLSQYGALMVMEKEYGPAYLRRFLRFEMDRYLKGRGEEPERELPLALVEFQPYIHYAKGGLAMYTLKDHLGEEALNEAIRAFVGKHAFQAAPYPTAEDFVQHLKEAAPRELWSVIEDLFERIVLYENRVSEAVYSPLADGSYRVTLELQARKLHSDGLGVEAESPMADWVDIGIFSDAESDEEIGSRPLYLQKHRLHSGRNILEIRVDERPSRAGVDPYYKLIDRNPDDNVARVILVRSDVR